MDLKVIADAIAARYVNVTATNGGLTETATATADLPDSVGHLGLLVYPPSGSLEVAFGATNRDQYDFMVKLLRDPVSMATRTQWLYAWANALRGRVELDMDLGLPLVVEQAETTTLRMAIDGEQYADVTATYRPFDVVELTIHVQIHEPNYPIGV